MSQSFREWIEEVSERLGISPPLQEDILSLVDPVALVDQLNPNAIWNRIDEIDRERKALIVLYRAAQRRRDK